MMLDQILRTGGRLHRKSRYQAIWDRTRAIICHFRYCQRYTGSAFGTQVWFSEGKVIFTSREIAEYENHTEIGNVVSLKFFKKSRFDHLFKTKCFSRCGNLPQGSFDHLTFLCEPQVENFCIPKSLLFKLQPRKSMPKHPM